MSTENSLLAITMGDAAGIGPEIILKSLATYYPRSGRTVVIGAYDVFRRAARVVGSPLALKAIRDPDEGDYRPGIANILEMDEPTPEQAPYGAVSRAAGKGSVTALRIAHQLSQQHSVRAIVSAPMHKQAMTEAGFSFSDECELMADLTGASTPMMLLVSAKMRMATLSPLHVPLRQACDNVTTERVQVALGILHQSLVSLGIAKPVIAVAALNPHAGEGGTLGHEEVREIIPAIKAARKNGWDIQGPFPADTLFFKASNGEFDAVLTMYHDQGRIAMKTLDFGRITIAMIGIPVPFFTVAHGTGYDIAGKGTADPANFIQVLQLADGVA